MGNLVVGTSCSPKKQKFDSNMDTHPDLFQNDAGSEKILYCIRHAQSESNAKRRSLSTYFSSDFWNNKCDPNIKDPSISTGGERQIATLQRKLDSADFVENYSIDVCFVSPFTRAIDTALGVFAYNASIRIIVLPDLRPHFKSAQSTGTLGKSALELKYKSHENICFDYLHHELWWNPKNKSKYDEKKDKSIYGCYPDDEYEDDDDYDEEKAWQEAFGNDTHPSDLKFETKTEFQQRQARFKRFLASRSEHNIVLVGHCGYFRNLLNIWSYVGNCSIVEAHFDAHTESVTHTAFVNF